jgi:AcrR family transcriptional regulator
MRVSRERKQENAERLIDAFVAEVRERGYDAVSLRDVARAAGMSDGAIYKHFATKEKLLLAYYALRMDRLREHGARLAERPGYAFAERMHELLEFQIGQYEGDKDFLAKTFRPTFISASLMWGEVAAMRKTYVDTVRGFLAAAESQGEIPALALPYVVEEMVWCHYVAVMLYWQRDGSDRHEDTTQFIDRTLKLFAAVVGGPLLPMAQDLVGFLVNRHLMPLLMAFGGMKPGAAWSGGPFAGPGDAQGKAGAGEKRGSGSAGTGKAAGRKAAGRSTDKDAKPTPRSPAGPRKPRKGAR